MKVPRQHLAEQIGLAAPRRPSRLAWVLALVITLALVRGLAHIAQWPWLYALLALPGTVLHEGAHAGVAWLLGAQPQGLSLWPARLADGSFQLGSVRFVPNAWNVAAISLAPLGLAGVAALCVALAVRVSGWWWRAGAVYIAACALSSSWPSGVDWGHALRAPLSWPLALVVGAVWWGAVVWALRAAWGQTPADRLPVPRRG